MQKLVSAIKSRSEFAQHVITLMTGTAVAQAIPIVISPILTRIFTPAEFGVFALFVAMTSIFGAAINLRYDMAIMLPESEDEALGLAILGLFAALFNSLILLLLIFIFNSHLISFLGQPDLEGWLYFIPLTVFLLGLFNVLNYYNSRHKEYRKIANTNMIKAAVLALIQIIFGALKFGVSALIAGALLSSFIAYIMLLRATFRKGLRSKTIDKAKIKALAVRYRDFPKYSAPGIFINASSQHLSSVFISALFSASTLGHYYLVQRMLGVPISLIGSSISQVYFQQASIERRETGRASKTFNATLVRLLIIGVAIFLPLFFIVEDLIALVFGEDWRKAGEYSKILLPFFFVRFISVPLIMTFPLFELQKLWFIINTVLLFLVLSVFWLSKVFSLDMDGYLVLSTVILSMFYAGVLFFARHISTGSYGR